MLGLAMTCMSYIWPLRKMDQEFCRVTLISIQHQWVPWNLFLMTGCRVLSAKNPFEIIFSESIGAKFTSFQGFSPFLSAVHHNYVHNFGDSLGKMEKKGYNKAEHFSDSFSAVHILSIRRSGWKVENYFITGRMAIGKHLRLWKWASNNLPEPLKCSFLMSILWCTFSSIFVNINF